MDWKEFELLIARLHETVSPGATVRHNHRLRGKSGRKRQLDVTISQRVGLYDTLIVIECRKYVRPISIEKVESFASKLEDVGATHGVMITNSDFDIGARAVASRKGITLLTYREATEMDWHEATRSDAWVLLLLSKFELESLTLRYEGTDQVHISPQTQFFTTDGQLLGTFGDLERQLTEAELRSIPPGPVKFEAIDPSISLMTDSGLSRVLSLEGKGYLRWWEYRINLTLASGHVLVDAHDNRVRLRELTTESWDVQELLQSQRGREVSPEEFHEMHSDRLVALPSFPASKLKGYMRIVITQEPSRDGTSPDRQGS